MTYQVVHSNYPSPESPGSGSQFSVGTVLNALRYWWKVVTPIGLMLAAAVTTAICYQHKPVYTAEAWLMMKEKPDAILRSIDNSSNRFIPTQIEIIRSARVLGPLASDPEVAATPELKDTDDMNLALAKALKVTARGNSDLYSVTFTSESPKHAHLVVKEVIDSYLNFHKKSESERNSRTVRLLEEQRSIRFDEMNQLRENVRALSVQLTGVDPFRANGKEEDRANETSPYAGLQADLVRQGLSQDILAAEIKAEEELLGDNAFEATPGEIEAAIRQHPRYQAVEARVERLRAREAEYQKAGRDLDKNVIYNKIQADLAADLEALETIGSELQDEIKTTVEKQTNSRRGERLAKMKRDFASRALQIKVLEDRLNQEIGSVKNTAKQYAGASLDLEFRRAKLEQITQIHDELQAKILAFNTEQRAPERVSLFKESTVPVQPSELIPWKKIMMGGAIAFFAPFGLAIAWEHLFRRVSSRSQLEIENQISVVGEVTRLPSTKVARTNGDYSDEPDQRVFEESVDGLRTYLSLANGSRAMKTIAVTSAVTREGKTSLSSQLAVSIARATGEPTLLIDGDMRAPDVHWVFRTELGPGLAEVLKKECDLDDAIETSFSDTLHVMTAGDLTVSPHKLLGSGEFDALLAKLSERYKHIVIDTPPVLAASESLVMARAADCVVVCVRCDYSRMDQVQDAYRRMKAAGVNMLGAVMNGVPVRKYVRRYGSYGYYSAKPNNRQ